MNALRNMVASGTGMLSAMMLFAVAAQSQVVPDGTSPNSSSGKGTLAFENAEIEVVVRKVIMMKDGAEFRVNMDVKNKAELPVWAMLTAPQPSIADDNGSVLQAKKLTGLQGCIDRRGEWKGAPFCFSNSHQDDYTRLEPDKYYPFTLQFLAGTENDEDKKLDGGKVQMAMRIQYLKSKDGKMSKENSIIDMTIRDLDPR